MIRDVVAWTAAIAAGLVGFVATIIAIGIAVEGVGQRAERIERCQKQAISAYEYHHCGGG